MAASDPFAFSKQRGGGAGRATGAAQEAQEWVFPTQTPAPHFGTMGQIGQAAPAAPFVAAQVAPSHAAFGVAAPVTAPVSQPSVFYQPPPAAVHQRPAAHASTVPSGAFDPSVIAHVARYVPR